MTRSRKSLGLTLALVVIGAGGTLVAQASDDPADAPSPAKSTGGTVYFYPEGSAGGVLSDDE